MGLVGADQADAESAEEDPHAVDRNTRCCMPSTRRASEPRSCRRCGPPERALADRYLFTACGRGAVWISTGCCAYSPLLWPDLVIYFSMTPEIRAASLDTRAPGPADVTGIDDPLASYGRFIDRVVTEYEACRSSFSSSRSTPAAPFIASTRVRGSRRKAEKRLVHVQRRKSRMADQVNSRAPDRR